ncbi:hypothetical protein [Paraburkholderia sediminicola]|uniref:hypothetical protein n=1 Tax=Paraburkholderia sediminicola TaxID=458836 RepID=UPI0011C39CC5
MRLRLDFGLRRAIMGFNEWAVPGLGGAFFVRQLSWACMGLRLAQEVETSATPARIAEALEAFASWIVVRRGAEAESETRVQGKRKFAGRNSLSFNDVAKGGAYVTVPFRRSATRALPGLKLCAEEEARFSSLELTRDGIELAELAFASGRGLEGDARGWLKEWIGQEDKAAKSVQRTVKAALEPGLASEAEKQLVLGCVRADRRRAVLADLLRTHSNTMLGTQSGRAALLDGVQDAEHAARLATCFAFEDVRTRTLRAAQSISSTIHVSAQEVRQLAGRKDVMDAFDELGRKCDALKASVAPGAPSEALGFCEEQSGSNDLATRIASLAGRAPIVFSVIGGRIDQGVAYTGKPLVADDAYDAQETEAEPVLEVPGPLLRFRRLLKDAEALK